MKTKIAVLTVLSGVCLLAYAQNNGVNDGTMPDGSTDAGRHHNNSDSGYTNSNSGHYRGERGGNTNRWRSNTNDWNNSTNGMSNTNRFHPRPRNENPPQ